MTDPVVFPACAKSRLRSRRRRTCSRPEPRDRLARHHRGHHSPSQSSRQLALRSSGPPRPRGHLRQPRHRRQTSTEEPLVGYRASFAFRRYSAPRTRATTVATAACPTPSRSAATRARTSARRTAAARVRVTKRARSFARSPHGRRSSPSRPPPVRARPRVRQRRASPHRQHRSLRSGS